jgi:hypothetical protein
MKVSIEQLRADVRQISNSGGKRRWCFSAEWVDSESSMHGPAPDGVQKFFV